jgi:hypothetical protein
MAEERRINGSPEVIIRKVKIKDKCLSVSSDENYSFTNDTNECETVFKQFKRTAHADLLECLNDLAPHLAEICNIDPAKCGDVEVTGYTAKDLRGEAPQVLLIGKVKSIDNKYVSIVTPLLFPETTSYKKARALLATMINLEDEVLQYVMAGKSADQAEWTLFTQGTPTKAASGAGAGK